MNKLLQTAATDYKANALKTRREISVPELPQEDGAPLIIYVKPANLKIRKQLVAFAEEGTLDLLVASIIARAEDENGQRLFNDSDKPVFMEDLDADFIMELATKINADMVEDTKQEFIDAEKN